MIQAMDQGRSDGWYKRWFRDQLIGMINRSMRGKMKVLNN
jgi:hypothetical protein